MKTDETNNNILSVRIAVLGEINVGKSALTVRFLTRRFIGEYRSNTDLLYRQTVIVNNTPIEVEIVDVSGDTADSPLPVEQVQWSDACVLVYSITDKHSFEYAQQALQQLHKMGRPLVLLANKADLEHLRQVQEEDGRRLAASCGAVFHEVSVAENSDGLYAAFEALLGQHWRTTQPKATRKFSVSKMLGTLIGSRASSSVNVSCAGGGTVVECRKADLRHSRMRRRWHHLGATASL